MTLQLQCYFKAVIESVPTIRLTMYWWTSSLPKDMGKQYGGPEGVCNPRNNQYADTGLHQRRSIFDSIQLDSMCAGSGIGTFILAPAVQMLIELYSWRGALLVLAGFVANLCVCGALMRPHKPKSKPGQRQVLHFLSSKENHPGCTLYYSPTVE